MARCYQVYRINLELTHQIWYRPFRPSFVGHPDLPGMNVRRLFGCCKAKDWPNVCRLFIRCLGRADAIGQTGTLFELKTTGEDLKA